MHSKVQTWLNFSKDIEKDQVDDACKWMFANPRLIDEMEDIFARLSSLLPEICQRLYAFSSSEHVFKHFTMLLVPSLLRTYLTNYWHVKTGDSHRNQRRSNLEAGRGGESGSLVTRLSAIESCLLRIATHHDQSSIDAPFEPTEISLYSSVFYSSSSMQQQSPSSTVELSDVFPLSPISSGLITSRTALVILFQIYCDTLSIIDPMVPPYTFLYLHSMAQFCNVCNRISSLTDSHRIPSSSTLLCKLLLGLDIVLFKLDNLERSTVEFHQTISRLRPNLLDAVNSVKRRSVYHCYSQPMLLAQAILQSRLIQSESCLADSLRVSNVQSATNPIDYKALLKKCHQRTHSNLNPSSDISNESVDVHNSLDAKTEVKVVTGATFRTETLPEDISPPNEPSSLSAPSQSATFVSDEQISNVEADVIRSSDSSSLNSSVSDVDVKYASVPNMMPDSSNNATIPLPDHNNNHGEIDTNNQSSIL